jgi:hypothetical protein
MKTWSALPNSWSGRMPMRHLLLCVGVLVGAVLMASYVRLLHQHMAQAGQSRLGQRTPAGELAASAVVPPR